jgi:pyruvate/2-oxoacid:ferredoxin oxidoreductase beta subunit
MEHPGFSIVHVQSPCTTYNDNYEQLKGNPKLGIEPFAWNIPDDHDPTDKAAAVQLVESGGIPLGLIYQDPDSVSLDQRLEAQQIKVCVKTAQELVDSYTT